MIKLYQHQQQLVDLNPAKHLLAHETGTGKTITAIALALKNVGGKGGVLVICPKSIKEQWEENIEKHIGPDNDWIVVTKENFRKLWASAESFDCVIVDEAHYFSGIKSQMYKSLASYVKKHQPKFVYLLTATPYLSTPWNIYCLAWILGYHWSYINFRNTFFTNVRMGNRIIPAIKRDIEPKIAELVQAIGSTVRLQDCVDLPEQIFETEYFDLTPEQTEGINQIKATEVNHIVKWTKIHQICGGTLKGNGYVETQNFKCEKLERLIDICSEHKKVVVVCRYNAEVDMIYKVINSKFNDIAYRFTGENSAFRVEMAKEVNSLDRVVVVVNAACCEGFELPTFDLMVFYSYDFSLKNYVQMIGRISRINNPKKNVYLSLVVRDTVDEDVMKCIESKKDFDLAIYNK